MRADTAENLRIWNASSAGLGIGVISTMGKINLEGFQRVRGTVYVDQPGTLVVNFYALGTDTVPAATFTVPQDTDQPDYRYSFDIIVLHPYVEISFTQGGVASTIFRGQSQALPN